MSYERRKVRVGRVVSDAMDKTVVVQVEWRQVHLLYGKSIRRRTRFKAHDEDNACRVGDTIRMIESRPLSRSKRWRVVEILSREEFAELQPEDIAVETPDTDAEGQTQQPPSADVAVAVAGEAAQAVVGVEHPEAVEGPGVDVEEPEADGQDEQRPIAESVGEEAEAEGTGAGEEQEGAPVLAEADEIGEAEGAEAGGEGSEEQAPGVEAGQGGEAIEPRAEEAEEASGEGEDTKGQEEQPPADAEGSPGSEEAGVSEDAPTTESGSGRTDVVADGAGMDSRGQRET